MKTLFFLGCLQICGAISLHPIKKAPCIVEAGGYEAIDDAPAINNAIKECGNAGIIVLPQDQIYSIHSTIDFSPCRNCDVQLEGRLLLYMDWTLWENKSAIISMHGVKGAKLRSLTGSGVVDGNSKQFFQRYRVGLQYDNQPVLLPIIGSSDILVDGITVRNAPKQFFRVDGQSSQIKFSNLNVVVENQWWQAIWTKAESIAFQFRNSSAVVVDTVNVNMNASRWGGPVDDKVGVCVGIDYSTSDIDIRNIYCNTSDGVLIQFGSVGFYNYPPADDQWARDIRISNLTSDAVSNGGFKNLAGFDYAKVHNLTYDGVDIRSKYTPLTIDLCYLISNGRSLSDICSTRPGGAMERLHAEFTDIWFKNYRGRISKTGLDCFYNSTCDFHFENWSNTGLLK
ncbi:glycoside hydrolase family 28 protein [Aaosphaeria arxii CBS 175.79]|uniref:Glycoside hydrolase family 28 protein n=1 Tax=Aaosphaeria arxii CBS 175.79 TaxID=1450172 RepID=A0A6A5XNF4_9PLEO|nr:glycoside hydrolase family 28 protein [Aaosphaeria arxii CBS 175.79]KAF2014377.1 glycoside hydrolase family 28 protein [Aaosphaeria arxii CBS 175.79]